MALPEPFFEPHYTPLSSTTRQLSARPSRISSTVSGFASSPSRSARAFRLSTRSTAGSRATAITFSAATPTHSSQKAQKPVHRLQASAAMVRSSLSSISGRSPPYCSIIASKPSAPASIAGSAFSSASSDPPRSQGARRPCPPNSRRGGFPIRGHGSSRRRSCCRRALVSRHELPKSVYHLQLCEPFADRDVHANRDVVGPVPPARVAPVVHRVGLPLAGPREALALLEVAPRLGQHVEPKPLLRREPIVVAAQPVLAHPALLPFKTSSNASRRVASSSVSLILRSASIALRRVFMSWLATAACPVASSSESTRSVRSSRSTLMEGSSRLGLLLAALEAILERCSALAGSWAQQYPCGPVAGALQGSPDAFVARHTAISGYPPLPGGLRGQGALRQRALE